MITKNKSKMFQAASLFTKKYQGPPANLTQGGANLAQRARTAQFDRQDALTGPNLTRLGLTWPNHARHCSDSKKNITSGRRAKRAARL